MCRRRLARHHLLERTDDIVEAVRAVGGVQAQLPSAAEWAIGARVDGITVDDVRAELWERKRLVKAYTLRGTLHLVPADEAAMWAAATQPLDDDELVEAVGRALRGRCLTRAELAEAVGDERLLSQWGDFVSPAAIRGVLCFGPPRGNQVTFVHREDWGVPWKHHDRAAAQREAAERYLHAYGPAAPKDFARWMHIEPAEAKAAFEGLDGGDDEGEAPPEGATTVRLLPQYDAYMLGAFPRDKVVPASAKPRTSSYGKGKWEGPAALPVVLVDGVVGGIWARKLTTRSVKVTVEPFVDLDEALVEAEVDRLGAFLNRQASFVIGRLP